MSVKKVYIVSADDIASGNQISSVHATLDGALDEIRGFLADEEERNRDRGPSFAKQYRWRQCGEYRWSNSASFLRIDVHEVQD